MGCSRVLSVTGANAAVMTSQTIQSMKSHGIKNEALGTEKENGAPSFAVHRQGADHEAAASQRRSGVARLGADSPLLLVRGSTTEPSTPLNRRRDGHEEQ